MYARADQDDDDDLANEEAKTFIACERNRTTMFKRLSYNT